MHRAKLITALALGLIALPAQAMYGFQAPDTFFHGWDATWSGRQILIEDANGDGLDDVVLTTLYEPVPFSRQAALLVLLQNPATHFLSPPQRYAATPVEWNTSDVSSIARGDVDGDGVDDIIFGHTDGVTVLDPAHAYAASQVIDDRANYLFPKIARVGDVDGDGKLDIAVLTVFFDAPSRLAVYRGDGAGHFDGGSELSLPGSCCFRDLRVQDINGDAKPDLVLNLERTTPHYDGPFGLWAYYNLGGGAFGSAPKFIVNSSGDDPGMVIGDMDGDHKLDLATGYRGAVDTSVALPAMRVYLYGKFGTPYRSYLDWTSEYYSAPGADVMRDMNGDGKQDLVYRDGGYTDPESGLSDCVESYAPSGGKYAYRYPFACVYGIGENMVAVGDINGDGLMDIVHADPPRGLGWALGTNSPDITNLVVGEGLSPGTVAFNIKNASTTKTLAEPSVQVKLSVAHGSFVITDKPDECELQYPYKDTMVCRYGNLAPGATATGVVHYSMTKIMPMARLTATARASTTSFETVLVDNNVTAAMWIQ